MDEELCGETYDHDFPPQVEGEPPQPWICRRCGAEIPNDTDDEGGES